MTRTAPLAALFLVLAAACGGSQTPAEPAAAEAPAAEAPAAEAPAAEAPAPIAAKGAMACTLEVALVCPAGEVDGCLRQAQSTTGTVTSVHVCMPDNQKIGVACTNEIALSCATGFVDACLTTPAASEFHICVAQK